MGKSLITFIVFLLALSSCSNRSVEGNAKSSIITENYELYPSKKEEALLILFPCFPCDAENTRKEFDIVNMALAKDISVLLLNFNFHLFLSESEKSNLRDLIGDAIKENSLKSNNVYIGGFSGGGNVSLLLSNYLLEIRSEFSPKGVFVVDPPLDLLALYYVSQKNIKQNYSAVAVEEAQWIVDHLDSELGHPKDGIDDFEKFSPYVNESGFIENISLLKDIKVRLYTEPDTTWWQINRRQDYKDLNAFSIEKMSIALHGIGGGDIEFIPTVDKGYRLDGTRHPHSWSIVDKEALLDWVLLGK